jgi:hypothetical protein
VSKSWNTLIIEFTPMGTPLFPVRTHTKMRPFSELKVSTEPFPPQRKYQDTEMTVRKYRPRGLICRPPGLHWSRTHGEKQQTSSHRKNKWLLDYCSFERSRLMQRPQTTKVSVRISLLDTHQRDPRSVFSSLVHRRRTARAKIHEFAWKFLLQLQFPLATSGSVNQVDNVAITH